MKPPSMLTVLITIFLLTSQYGLAQDAANADAARTNVVLVKLLPPVYPPLARQARIAGDVKVYVHVRKDGSVESAELFIGHPMLAPAALESARQSQYECRGCDDGTTDFQLIYAFELKDDGDCCTASSRQPEVTQSANRISIRAAASCICDPTERITRIKWRSAKCLYLWHCSSRVTDIR
jgi:TonB family protein